MTKNISTIKAKKGNLTWINITNAQRKEINYLARKYKFNELDLEDSFASKYAQRPKFYNRNNYSFLILQFPIFSSKKRIVEPEEIDFFITKDTIVTVHKNNLPPLAQFFNLCSSDDFYRGQYLNSNASMIYEIIVQLQEYCYPLLDHISLDIKKMPSSCTCAFC